MLFQSIIAFKWFVNSTADICIQSNFHKIMTIKISNSSMIPS